MVFESVLTDVLNKFLKPYVKKLDTSQLKLGIWGGNVSLGKLELKEDLFDELDLPLTIKRSYIGDIKMKIPWKSLAKDPIIVNISDVYVIVAPYFDRPYSEERHIQKVKKDKEKQIAKIEEAAKKMKQDKKKGSKKENKDPEKPDTFAEKLATHLVKNLKVSISNIHVRYEDSSTTPNTTISIGASLHSLELISTDNNWQACVVKETATLIYKLVELNSMAVYWNTYSQTLADLPGDTEWMTTMKEQIARPGMEPPATNTYVLQPLSANLKVKLNLKPKANLDIPQVFGNFECEDIDLSLREDQFKNMMFLLDSFSRFKLNEKYFKYKPVQSVRESKRAWWNYAYQAILEEDVKRRLHMWSWKRIKKHRENCRLYTEKYYEKITSKATFSSLTKQLDELENELDVFNIMMCRKLARKRKKSGKSVKAPPSVATPTDTSVMKLKETTPTVPIASPSKVTNTASGGARPVEESGKKKKDKKGESKKSSGGGFFSKFKKKLKEPDKVETGAAGLEATPTDQPLQEEFTELELPPPGVDLKEKEKEKEKFFEAIGYSEEDEYVEFPPTYIAHQIEAGIKSIKIHLLDKKRRLVTVTTSNVSAQVFHRATNDSVSVTAAIGGFNVVGVDGGNSVMVTPSTTPTSNEPLVDFRLDLKPLDRTDMDMVVKACVRPLKIVYHEDTIDGLIGAFRVKKNIHLMELTSAASSSVQELQSRTSVGLQNALQDRKQVEIDVSIQSPYIILPEKGYYQDGHRLILIDFGSLSIKGSTKDYKNVTGAMKSNQGSLLNYYDSFFIKLSDLQVLVVKPGDDWMKARIKGSSSLHVMEKTALEVELRKSIVSDDALLPSLQVIGDFAGFKVEINDDKLRTALTIVQSLKLPPPALKNTTTYYNELPPPPTVSSVSGGDGIIPIERIVRTFSVDTMSLIDDEDDFRSFSPTSSIMSTVSSENDEDASRFVFTDVKMNFKIRKVEVVLNQVDNKRGSEVALLAVSVSGMQAEVNDRNWDLQGNVSIKEIAIHDYITKTSDGKPTNLLETESLKDGNFISARFVKITPVGIDFASKYTGLNNSASVQLSLVKVNVNQGTVIGLIRFLVALKPALEKKQIEVEETDDPGGPKTDIPFKKDRALSQFPQVDEVPSTASSPPMTQFNLKAGFEGIHFNLNSTQHSIMKTAVKGLSVDIDLSAESTSILASIDDVVVLNSAPKAEVKEVVSKMDTNEKMVQIKVNHYPNATKGPHMHNLDNVDVAVDGKVQRVKAYLDSGFVGNLLEFLVHVKNESSEMLAASVSATKDTAVATASALKDTSVPSFRVRLNITLLAPLILVPFKSHKSVGTFCISLGNFVIGNRFIHGYETYDTRGTSISLATGHSILDRIEIKCSDISLYIESRAVNKMSGQDGSLLPLMKSEILNDLHFVVVITRNLSSGFTHLFPDVKIDLTLEEEIKFTVSDGDIQSLFTIVTALSKLADTLPKSKPAKKPALTRTQTISTGVAKPRGLSQLKTNPAARLEKFDPDQVIKVQVKAEISTVSLELYKRDKKLLRGSVSGINSVVKLTPKKLMVNAQVEGYSITDPQLYDEQYNKILSLAEMKHSKALSLSVEVPLDDSVSKGVVRPLASIDLTIGRFQLYLPSDFIKGLLDFVLSLDVNPGVVKKATKAAQEGATVAKELVQDVYVKFKVYLRAPTILLPDGRSTALMLDLGNIHVNNEASEVEKDAVIDSITVSLENFKLSRVLLSSGCDIVTERSLIKPYSLEIKLRRNLCNWNTSYPAIDIDIEMGEFMVLLGEEDILFIAKFGINMAEEFVPLLSKKGKKQIKLANAVVDGLTEGVQEDTPTTKPAEPPVSEGEAPYKKISLSVLLKQFSIELFTNEPKLTNECPKEQVLSDDFSLTCFQLVSASTSLGVYSNDRVQLKAAVLDLTILDKQPEQQRKKTGDCILQRFTKNPLKPFTGIVTEPLLSVDYVLNDSKHEALVIAKDILLLSDIGYLQSIADHFKNIFSDIEPPKLDDRLAIDSPASSVSSIDSIEESTLVRPPKKPLQLPSLKFDLHVKNVRVAIVESQDDREPQALMLKVSIFSLIRFDPDNNTKNASLNISNLGVTTSNFCDLETATSAVLVPMSLFLNISGPLDNLLAMDINGTISTVSLKLSPPIVRLTLHAVKTLATTAKKPRPPPAPPGIWNKQQINSSKLWYLLPVPLHSQQQQKSTSEGQSNESNLDQTFTLTIEGIEVVLETEATERVSGLPVLSCNVTGVLQAFDWTGKLSVSAEILIEASYFNTRLSVWEPLLEPLVTSSEELKRWTMNAEINRSTADDPAVPEFSVSLKATNPLQLTFTKSSISVMKDIAESCTKEYGKKVEGSVNVDSLTGAPFTIVNQLGLDMAVYVKPGDRLKFLNGGEFHKISSDESVDIFHKRVRGHTSYASLVTQSIKKDCSVDLSIGKEYKNLSSIPIDSPGLYYHQLKTINESLGPSVGVVIDVKVTGAKKTIKIRSPLQVHNHTQQDIELLFALPMKPTTPYATVEPGDVYSVPFGLAFTGDICLRPKSFGMEPSSPKLVWQKFKRDQSEQQVDISCRLPGGDGNTFFMKVIAEEDTYNVDKCLPEGVYVHHVYHLYSPVVIQNLLPSNMTIEAEDGSIHPFELKSGEVKEVHLLDLSLSPYLFINLPDEELCGRFHLPKDLPKEMSFIIGKGRNTVLLSVLHEDLGYHRLSIYCPFWMVNKTDLQLVYKDEKSGRVYKQPPHKNIVLLSCEDAKSPKIRLNCYTNMGSRTEWSKSFSLQAVGTSGRISSKLSEASVFEFGVAIQLAKFTLSKLVIITPYYMIANQTDVDVTVSDDKATNTGVTVPGNALEPFWPNAESSYLSLTINGCKTKQFSYKSSDTVTLSLDTDPRVVCVEIQETSGANIITISSYFEGCVPVLIMNLFPSITLMYKQDRESDNTGYLRPGESIYYTWEDPTAKKMLKWGLKSMKLTPKPIDISKDGKDSFSITPVKGAVGVTSSKLEQSTTMPSYSDSWLSLASRDDLSESLVSSEGDIIDQSKSSPLPTSTTPITRGHWVSFLDGLQRVLVFTHDQGVIDRLKAVDTASRDKLELSVSLRSIGVSLINDIKGREVAYIGVTQSGVIWQVARKKGHWKTLSTSEIATLEDSYQRNCHDIKTKDLVVNFDTMEMFLPTKGSLRRTHYEGVELRAAISENEYSVNAKIGYVQIDNQLPIAVYPQMLYPLPPPPTVASTIEPKPFIEASVIIRKTEQRNVNHFKYVHVLMQRLVVNVDLGFVLALLELVRATNKNELLEAQYVLNDIEYTNKTLQDIALPAASDESVKRNFFDVLHVAPIKITLSFSVGHNKFDAKHIEERFLHLFLHSLGVILTSVQEAQMNFSLFHLEYIAVTWSKLIDLFVKHYRTQGLVAVHSLVLGLDVLGNPVNVVRGVVSGTFDLFYEPIKGSVLGPSEFADGLGIGLKSFFGGTVGGLTGAGARITGTVGDVFAKLSFDSNYMDRRQQDKAKSSGIGSTFGGFFKNVAEGVTGVVVQPIKGVKEDGALGFFKGTGIGLVGLLVRPAGGLFDLTSGTLDFVTKKTKVGNVDIVQIRPPRYIGRDGIVTPYYPKKAIGKALLQDTDEGKYTSRGNKKDDYYVDHMEVRKKPLHFIIATDRRFLIIERAQIVDGWKSIVHVPYDQFSGPSRVENNVIVVPVHKQSRKFTMNSNEMASEGNDIVMKGLGVYKDNFVK